MCASMTGPAFPTAKRSHGSRKRVQRTREPQRQQDIVEVSRALTKDDTVQRLRDAVNDCTDGNAISALSRC